VVTIFNAGLGAAFVPSSAILIAGNSITLDFEVVVTGAPATVQFFLEQSSDKPTLSTARWFQEMSEETASGGVVVQAKVIRTFQENGGALLAAGTHRMSTQFIRKHRFARIQMRVTVGAASARVDAPLDSILLVP